MDRLYVHPRITERHPDLSESDVLAAWENAIAFLPRLGTDPVRYIAIGADMHGRLVEMVGQKATLGTWVIFHAMTPPTRKTLAELGLGKR